MSQLTFLIVKYVWQAYEDWLRHKADRAINDRVVKKVTAGEGGLTDIKAKKVSPMYLPQTKSNE